VEPLDAPHTPADRLIRGIVLGGFLVLAVEAWLLLHVEHVGLTAHSTRWSPAACW
jgi:hypothetical protein